MASLSDRDVRSCHKRRLRDIGWRSDLRRRQVGLQDKTLGLFAAIAM